MTEGHRHEMVETSTEAPPMAEYIWPDKPVATCHCGAVKLELPEPPTDILECRCSVCYRYGALWTYFHLNQVNVSTSGTNSLRRYVREDGDGNIAFYSCANCGCLTHWCEYLTIRALIAFPFPLMRGSRESLKKQTGFVIRFRQDTCNSPGIVV